MVIRSTPELDRHEHRIYYEYFTSDNGTNFVTIRYYDIESHVIAVFDPTMPSSLPRNLVIFKNYIMTLVRLLEIQQIKCSESRNILTKNSDNYYTIK